MRTLIAALIGLGSGGLAMTVVQNQQTPPILGYTYGQPGVPRAPITMEELDLLKKTVLLTDDDIRALRMSEEVLRPHVGELVGVWYKFVGDNPHLLAAFSNPETGKPDPRYLDAVRARFERWVLDTARADFDQEWLDYQFEIGRRHHRTGKNRTDDADAAPHIPYRYIPVLTIPVTATLRPFLERGDHSPEEVDRMHAAWKKAVLLQTILWGYPYIKEGDF